MILVSNPTAGPLISGNLSRYMADAGVVPNDEMVTYTYQVSVNAGEIPSGKVLCLGALGVTDDEGMSASGFPPVGTLLTSLSAVVTYRWKPSYAAEKAAVVEVWIVDPSFDYEAAIADPFFSPPTGDDAETLVLEWCGDRFISEEWGYGPHRINLASGTIFNAYIEPHAGDPTYYPGMVVPTVATGWPPGDAWIHWDYFAVETDPLLIGLDTTSRGINHWEIVTVEEPVDEHGAPSSVFTMPTTVEEDPSSPAYVKWAFGPLEKDIPDPDGHYIGLIKWHAERTHGFDPIDHPDACATFDGRLWLTWNINYATGPSLLHQGTMS